MRPTFSSPALKNGPHAARDPQHQHERHQHRIFSRVAGVHQHRQKNRRGQQQQRPIRNRPAKTFAPRHGTQAGDIKRQRRAAPDRPAVHAPCARRAGDDINPEPAQAHQPRRGGDDLVRRVVNDDAAPATPASARRWFCRERPATVRRAPSRAKPQRQTAASEIAPDGIGRDGAALPVKFRVEGVVQKHAAGVKRADAEKQQRQFPEISAAAEPPAGEAVRPDRRQIRHAAQNEQRAELAD